MTNQLPGSADVTSKVTLKILAELGLLSADFGVHSEFGRGARPPLYLGSEVDRILPRRKFPCVLSESR